jgi:hypothetical protein
MAIAADLALALDPARMAERCGLAPDPWQADLLRSAGRQLILNCSRQSGKSTVSSLLALHEALYRPPALVLLLSPSLRQSQELFRKVKDAHDALRGAVCPVAEESALRIEWANGSRVVCLPGREQTIRGFSGVSLLVVDEASRVPDALYYSVRPMLAVSGGRIVLLSTPFGRRGFFFEVWENGGPAWERTEIAAEQCPRIPADWLAQEREAIGEWWFSQEYGCQFRDTLDQVFGYDEVMRAVSDDVAPLFGQGPPGRIGDGGGG